MHQSSSISATHPFAVNNMARCKKKEETFQYRMVTTSPLSHCQEVNIQRNRACGQASKLNSYALGIKIKMTMCVSGCVVSLDLIKKTFFFFVDIKISPLHSEIQCIHKGHCVL